VTLTVIDTKIVCAFVYFQTE